VIHIEYIIVHAYLQVIDFQENIITTVDSLHVRHASAISNLKLYVLLFNINIDYGV